jgi:putative transposase
MSRDRYKILPDDNYPYFLTETTINWLPLFSNPAVANIVFDSLRFLVQEKRILIYAYVLMENHLHLVASAEDLAKEMANFKSYTARRSIDFYEKERNQFILKQLALLKLPHRKDRPYQFWQEGHHPKLIQDDAMMRQKIEYIHYNPVKRGYVDEAEHWRYLSARVYSGMEGEVGVCMDWCS